MDGGISDAQPIEGRPEGVMRRKRTISWRSAKRAVTAGQGSPAESSLSQDGESTMVTEAASFQSERLEKVAFAVRLPPGAPLSAFHLHLPSTSTAAGLAPQGMFSLDKHHKIE